jgi:hypothetical protein
MASGLPLDILARDISARLDKSEDQLVAVAIHLAEAQERVEAGEAGNVSFADWCAEHIRLKDGKIRSITEIKRLISYGRSPDPAAKIERRREQVRGAVARKAAKTGLANPEIVNEPAPYLTLSPLDIAWRAYVLLSDTDKMIFRSRL